MRGSHRQLDNLAAALRIIPAHAGLTPWIWGNSSVVRDHPRACGAHQTAGIIWQSRRGSSPRMRGSRRLCSFSYLNHGIIPAHAGLTNYIIIGSWFFWDHPRACGAHLYISMQMALYQGSSPRMRGSLSSTLQHVALYGIIPAHAGLTPS